MPVDDKARELRQTRDYLPEEEAALNARLQALMWPAPVRRRFKLMLYLNHILIWTFALAFGLSVRPIGVAVPHAAVVMVWAGLGAVTCFVIRRQMSRRFRKEHCVPSFTAGDLYRLEESGLHHHRAELSFACPLQGIRHVANERDYLVALLPYNHSLLLAKAAFADQDADVFCAELERRWHAARGSNVNA